MNARARRELWTYYSIVDPKEKICMCRVCGKHLKFKSSVNLRLHLIRVHSIKDVGRTNGTFPIIVQRREPKTEDHNETNELEDSENNSISEIEETPISDNEDEESDVSLSITQPASNTVSVMETPISSAEYKEMDAASSNTLPVSSRTPIVKTLKHTNEEHEFDIFCKSLAIQLKKLPLDRALRCQKKLLNIMTEERLKACNLSSGAPIYIPVSSTASRTSNISTDTIVNSSAFCEDNTNSDNSDS